MTAIDLSSYAGLCAMFLLTANILLGLLISVRYNPVRNWPHRRINIFWFHNRIAYFALGMALVHPSLLLLSKTAGFKLTDLLWPQHSPNQTFYNMLGALALYTVVFVVVTSYFRPQLGHKRWKPLHFATYLAAGLFYVHGILIDPELKNQPTDFLDGEKVEVELCCALVVAGTIWRIRYGMRRRKVAAVSR